MVREAQPERRNDETKALIRNYYTVPAEMDKHAITWTVGNGDLYSVLPKLSKGEHMRSPESIRKTVAIDGIRQAVVRSSVFSCEVLTSEQRKLKK
jgi:hypothetical protein